MWLRSFGRATIDVVAPMITGTVDSVAPERSNSFKLTVKVYLAVATACPATVTVTGGWASDASVTVPGSSYETPPPPPPKHTHTHTHKMCRVSPMTRSRGTMTRLCYRWG